jgi:hypothetical protein
VATSTAAIPLTPKHDDNSTSSTASVTTLSEPIDSYINAVDIISQGITSSIPVDITVSEPLDFDCGNPDPAFDRDNPSIPTLPIQSITPVYDPDDPRGQLDTGAKASVTNNKNNLHRYREYTKSHPPPVRLTAAIDNGDPGIFPEGEGYLRVPAPNARGYIEVLTYYSPHLTSTLISENGLYNTSTNSTSAFSGQTLHKHYTDPLGYTGNFTLTCHHRLSRRRNLTIYGVLIGGQCYTHPLILPDVDVANPFATARNSIDCAKRNDPSFATLCANSVRATIQSVRLQRQDALRDALRRVPRNWLHQVAFHDIVDHHIPVHAIKSRTEKLLWHQRLGHPCDRYLYDAHKSIIGIPQFKRETEILNQCPTCIQAKQTKSPAGPHSTRKATRPYQGLSIDFSFSGMTSADEDRRNEYEGINGETSWILVTDHFTGMKHGDSRISKAAPLSWLRHFLAQYSPTCHNKYVHMDQGGELFNNPDIRNLFTQHNYDIYPTGADTSRQNGPVERGHRTLGNSIRALLTGSNLDTKFWPYAFYHSMRLSNAFPEAGKTSSPIELATSQKEDLSDLRTFGCRVWVRPPGKRKAKFKNVSKKGIFLGYVPYTTRNILWYDMETHRVKIAAHARFDEGMNDLPISAIPPNVQHLQRTDDGQPYPSEQSAVDATNFTFFITPFATLLHRSLTPSPTSDDPTYGLILADDDLLRRTYVSDVQPKSPAASIYSTLRSTRNKIRGAYIMEINNDRVFTTAQALAALKSLHDQGVTDDIPITFAPESKLTAKGVRRAANEYGLFAPTTKWDDTNTLEDPPFLDREATINVIKATKLHYTNVQQRNIAHIASTGNLHAKIQSQLAPTEDNMDTTVPSIDIHSLRAITKLRNPDLSFEENDITNEMISLFLNAIQSKATTPQEQALGHFTRRKLKQMPTWSEWEQGERKQLDQFHALQMFGEPITPPNTKHTIILRPHWQYHIKCDGTRRARQCCNGSKHAAPLLHALSMTYSSCVEHPIQRLFFAISAQLNLKVYGGDAKDAYAHSPGPGIPTYMTIDDQYADWYKWRFRKDIDRKKVLLVKRALQGHPESGRLWETHINSILTAAPLNFKSTTHDKTIYKSNYGGETIYLLRQVDDFALACSDEDIAKSVYKMIGSKLKLPGEDKDPFTYLGEITDFNGIDINQTKDYIELSCSNYIDRIMTSHGWTKDKAMQPLSKPIAPLNTETLHQIGKHNNGPKEGTAEHQALEERQGFSYRTLLGEMMFAYVSCRPDIGYAITLMSKYGSNPDEYHYKSLKNIARYLRTTKHWGIRFKRPVPHPELKEGEAETIYQPKDLPSYPEDIAQGKLICFVDAAYGNDPKKRRSTTGYAFTYAGGAIVYRSKTQSIIALSSTEAELIAAVTAAKTARYIRAVLSELGFKQDKPTPIYEDNKSAIDIVNAFKPTERSRHIDIRFFAIQGWKEQGDIIMLHIPGVINAADDLTKPLGWVLHSRHARYLMGHYDTKKVDPSINPSTIHT